LKELLDVSAFDSVKKHKKKGIVVLLLCVLACKLPLLIALVGLGSASLIMPLSPAVQTLLATVTIVSALAIVGYLAYQVYVRVKA